MRRGYVRSPGFLASSLGIGLALMTGCGGGPSTGDFVEACESGGNMGTELCECLAEKAHAKLSPGAYAFLVASLAGDETEELRAELSVEDLAAGGMFMVSGPALCLNRDEE